MPTEKPLIDDQFLLHKYPGKGGWTYALLPLVLPPSSEPFGWVKVKGSVDGVEFTHSKLMPTKEGELFFPVKAAIRKKIKKEAGDTAHIILYKEDTPLEIPAEIMACFQQEDDSLYQTFISFTEGEQKAYLDWIYAAKKTETQTERIVRMLERLGKGLPLRDAGADKA